MLNKLTSLLYKQHFENSIYQYQKTCKTTNSKMKTFFVILILALVAIAVCQQVQEEGKLTPGKLLFEFLVNFVLYFLFLPMFAFFLWTKICRDTVENTGHNSFLKKNNCIFSEKRALLYLTFLLVVLLKLVTLNFQTKSWKSLVLNMVRVCVSP